MVLTTKLAINFGWSGGFRKIQETIFYPCITIFEKQNKIKSREVSSKQHSQISTTYR
jgi:hypothetical protein